MADSGKDSPIAPRRSLGGPILPPPPPEMADEDERTKAQEVRAQETQAIKAEQKQGAREARQQRQAQREAEKAREGPGRRRRGAEGREVPTGSSLGHLDGLRCRSLLRAVPAGRSCDSSRSTPGR